MDQPMMAMLRELIHRLEIGSLTPSDDGWPVVEQLCDWFQDQCLIAALAQRDTVLRRAARLEQLIRSLEWGDKDDSGNPNYDDCWACGWHRVTGHMGGCALAPLLAALTPGAGDAPQAHATAADGPGGS